MRSLDLLQEQGGLALGQAVTTGVEDEGQFLALVASAGEAGEEV